MGAPHSFESIKAAHITRTGSPEVVTCGDLPEPKPGPTQRLIKVSAVDVNPIDTYVRSGLVPAKLDCLLIFSRDLAGVVVETGANVKGFKPGDRVWASNQGSSGHAN